MRYINRLLVMCITIGILVLLMTKIPSQVWAVALAFVVGVLYTIVNYIARLTDEDRYRLGRSFKR